MSNGTDTIYRPGVAVLSRASVPPQGVPTDTSVGFIIGEASQGPTTPTLITSLDQFVSTFGARLVTSYLYDGAEAFFREGGSSLFVIRLVDGAAAAEIAVPDLGADAILTADGVGAYANGMHLIVKAGTSTVSTSADDDDDDEGSGQGSGSQGASGAQGASQGSSRLTFPEAAGDPFTAQLLDATGKLVQQSLVIHTADDLAGWLTSQNYATLTGYTPGTVLAALDVTLAAGDDGTVPVTDADALADTLATVSSELGPGQIWAPGKTDPEMQAALLAHCGQVKHRVTLLDAPQGADVPTLIAQASAMRGAAEDRYGSLWAPWVTVPGVARGTTRTIPWSSIQAGMCARVDAQYGHANRAAAGDFGQSYFALGVTQTFADPDRQTLLYAGVDTVRFRYGTVRAYAFRSLSDENGTNGQWVQFNHGRLNMQIVADSFEIGEEYVFSQIDGRGLTIAAFNGQLSGMLKGLFDLGALFGDSTDDAYAVNTSSSVNTIETIANGELHAVIGVKMSPHAELVEIEIVKVALTEALA